MRPENKYAIGMYHILLPVDLDEDRTRAQADYVLDFPAEPADLKVTILYVLAREDAPTGEVADFAGNEGAVRAANRIGGEGILVNRELAAGEPISGQILETAQEANVDQIVMAGRKRSGVAKVLIGSTATDVIQAADRPVVVLG